ncbi:MAG: LysR family transcriptional regulator [Luteimonas sp.]
MTLEQLRVFVAVAEVLHVTRAAEALHITQSAASASVAALEARYQTKLFHRVGRRIELTNEGAQFLPEARAVLRRAAAAEHTLAELTGLQRGELRVAASQTVVNDWLPARLVAFQRRYPGVHLLVSACNTTQAERAVLDGSADLGVVEGSVDGDGFVLTAVDGDRLVLVVPLGHDWLARDAVAAAAFAGQSWVMREPGSGTRALFEDELRRHGINPATLPVALELPSNAAVLAAVDAGAGAAVVSALAARHHRAQTVAFALPQRRFTIFSHRERTPSRAQQALHELLVGTTE